MARILDDRIICDEADPYIAIQMPDQMKHWIERAANLRGTTVQDMLIELLYDYYHYSMPADASWENPHASEPNAAERLRRDYLVHLRWSTYQKIHNVPFQSTKRRMAAEQWARYEELRAKNLDQVYNKVRSRCIFAIKTKRTSEERKQFAHLYPEKFSFVAKEGGGGIKVDNHTGKIVDQWTRGGYIRNMQRAVMDGLPRAEIEALRRAWLDKDNAERRAKDKAKGGRSHTKNLALGLPSRTTKTPKQLRKKMMTSYNNHTD